jgi:hypothetical protein
MTTRQILLPLAALALIAVLFVFRPFSDPGSAVVGGGVGADGDTVRQVCTGCHLFPDPSVLPRPVWRAQIEHMAFLGEYLAAGGTPFDVDSFVAWYEDRAPEELPMESAITRDEPAPLHLDFRAIGLGRESGPGVATVGNVGSVLAVPNMARGSVHLLSWVNGPRLIGDAGHPARVSAGDLDGNGLDDLVVADLGNPLPTDEPTGRVLVGLQLRADEFELRPLVEGIGRVADVRPIDIDLDGDLDLVVAAFGYLREGGVYVLHNESVAGTLDFRMEQVTDRAGAVSVVPVADLQPGDGPGFVAAFAQEHETVSLFLPLPGAAGYEERVLFRAAHPAWGTSHLESTDLDGDGDVDFLLSNGDTLDDGVAFKPYHGVTWLENRGEDGFRANPIGRLYGAHAAVAGDLDLDGDLDVVAAGFLPQVQLPVPAGARRLDSVVWFEREGDGWNAWKIESGHPRHTGVTLFDLDEDGRLDVVAAVNRAWDVEPADTGPSLEVWFNRGPR